MKTKTRILFVDDEALVLQGLRRSTHPMRKEWDVSFLDCAQTALEFMARQPAHVVVSDMRMPGMNGAELLARVREESPDTVRVMLTGNADFQTAVDAVNQGHVFQFLLKPCEGEQLIKSVTAAVRQHELQTAERNLLVTQLGHAEKLTLIGQLAAGINHDLNNILAAIVAQTQVSLAIGDRSSPDNADTLARIQEAALRAAELTRELNAFSRNGNGADVQTVSLADVVKSMVRIVQPMLKHRARVHVELPAGLPAVRGSAGKLKQALMNLLINARDAMPEGGDVFITARTCDFAEAEVGPGQPRRAGAFVQLSLEDTGCGMDDATRGRLAEPFFTTKPPGQGTGLGLYMVHNILEQHQGWVEVESAVGEGTAFHLFLPRATPASQERIRA